MESGPSSPSKAGNGTAIINKNASNAASLAPAEDEDDLYAVGEKKRWRCVNCDLIFTSVASLGPWPR